MAVKKVRLGMEVKDKVTKYQGIATSITEHLQGCRRIEVQPPVKEDGSLPDSYVFDEPLLEVVGDGILPKEKEKEEPPGGPITRGSYGR